MHSDLGVDHLTFEEGRGGGRIGLCNNFFILMHWPVFFFTVKALQEFFSQIFHPPPPPLKSQMVRLSQLASKKIKAR